MLHYDLNMFRAARCSSSGGQILSPRPVVSSPSVNSRTVRRLRADWMHNFFILQQYVYYTTILNMFRAACCSKHVEDRSVTYILLKNKGIMH